MAKAQRPGDICENCRQRWENRKIEPKILQHVGKTMQKKMFVAVCEYCDGGTLGIFRAQANS